MGNPFTSGRFAQGTVDSMFYRSRRLRGNGDNAGISGGEKFLWAHPDPEEGEVFMWGGYRFSGSHAILVKSETNLFEGEVLWIDGDGYVVSSGAYDVGIGIKAYVLSLSVRDFLRTPIADVELIGGDSEHVRLRFTWSDSPGATSYTVDWHLLPKGSPPPDEMTSTQMNLGTAMKHMKEISTVA